MCKAFLFTNEILDLKNGIFFFNTMKKKNVLMLTDWYPTKNNPIKGNFIKEQIEAIRELGYNCLIGYRNDDFHEVNTFV